MKISIIIPVFNEVNYIEKVIDKVYEKKKEFETKLSKYKTQKQKKSPPKNKISYIK